MSLSTSCFPLLARMVATATGSQMPSDMPAPDNWANFGQLCRQHHVTTLVLPIAKQWPGTPPQVLDEMGAVVRANSIRALTHMAELVALYRLFTDNGIRFLVLKGVPLSLLLYGNPTRRSCGDIDLLVSPTDFAKAAEVLCSHGYALMDGSPTLTGNPDQDSLIRDLSLRRKNILIDLHQRLTGNSYRLPLSFDALYEQRATVKIAECPIPILGPTYLGLYLFVHGAGHGWERLNWLADIAILCRDTNAARTLYDQAVEQGMAKAAEQTFALLRHLFGCSLPHLPGPTKPSWLTLRLAQGHTGHQRNRAWLVYMLGMSWHMWRLRRGRGGLWRELAYDLWNPVGASYIRLPSALSWLAPVLRPFGFIWHTFRNRNRGL